LEEAGDLRVAIEIINTYNPIKEGTIRAIRVPFAVKGVTEIASITDGFKIQVPDGNYTLFFLTGKNEEGMWSTLTFAKAYNPEAEILICDGKLLPGKQLLMSANPAL
jgi:hypothetical protein